MGGADALAEMVGETCDMDGMDEKVRIFNLLIWSWIKRYNFKSLASKL